MADVPSVCWMEGGLVPFAEASVPVEDRGLQLAESIYEVCAVTRGEVDALEAHARRMRTGAGEIGIAAGVPDEVAFRSIARALLERDPLEEGLLYAQVTGGTAPRAHLPAETPEATFFAYLRPYRFPREPDVSAGIRAITRLDPRWARCDIKTVMLLPAVLAKKEAAAAGAGETIFLGADGRVHEGGSSNVLLLEDGVLVSPTQTERVLPGITGPRIRGLAEAAGLEVRSESVGIDRLRSAGEAMVASTTFLLMPVTHLDGEPVGEGRPGPVATDLARRFREELGLD